MEKIQKFKHEALQSESMIKITGGGNVTSRWTENILDDNGCCNSCTYTDSFNDTDGDGKWGECESGTLTQVCAGWENEQDC